MPTQLRTHARGNKLATAIKQQKRKCAHSSFLTCSFFRNLKTTRCTFQNSCNLMPQWPRYTNEHETLWKDASKARGRVVASAFQSTGNSKTQHLIRHVIHLQTHAHTQPYYTYRYMFYATPRLIHNRTIQYSICCLALQKCILGSRLYFRGPGSAKRPPGLSARPKNQPRGVLDKPTPSM